MNQDERARFLIRWLREDMGITDESMPADGDSLWRELRGLMNIRTAKPITDEFLRVQDEYLMEMCQSRGMVTTADMEEAAPDLFIWKGDITRLKVGAIVNAANSRMTGCYTPNHACIDNFIHSYAGVQLRAECQKLMDAQGFPEPTGQAKITSAYNLPCDYVLHTVGPIISGDVSSEDERLLASCYESCLMLCNKRNITSIAFCCISTGLFRFPNQRAAEIAVETVRRFKSERNNPIQIIFNVFKEIDESIYRKLLSEDSK